MKKINNFCTHKEHSPTCKLKKFETLYNCRRHISNDKTIFCNNLRKVLGVETPSIKNELVFKRI